VLRAAQAYLRYSRAAIGAIAALTLAVMVAINAAEIAHRLAFVSGLNWVQELSIILAMALYFLTYALIAKDREYIRIDLVARLFGPRGRRALAIGVRLVVLAFHGMVAWYAAKTTQFAALFETHILAVGEWVYYLPLAVGCADIVVTEIIYLGWQLRGVELDPERAGLVT